MDGLPTAVLRVEMIWDAGRPYEPKPLVGALTDELLLEGTRHRPTAALDAYFEQFGTHPDQADLMDTANLGLSTIVRHAGNTLPVLAEIIAEPALAEDRFRRIIRRRRQRLRENLADNDTLAYRLISEFTYGAEHPYGYNSTGELYAALTVEDVRAYHASHYHAGNGTLLVIGQVDATVERLLDDTFGQLPTGPRAPRPTLPDAPTDPGIFQLRKPRAGQTMIRRSRPGVDIHHPDYPALAVLETVYGGYFGSRLMRNIREDKGLTYGIDSDLETYRFAGALTVAADVANENLELVRGEIATEARKLRQDLIPAPELDMVRAYLTGSIAMQLDGRFGHAYRWRAGLIKDYEPRDYLLRLNEAILDVSAARLRELAEEYLDPAREWELILGGADVIDEATEIQPPANP